MERCSRYFFRKNFTLIEKITKTVKKKKKNFPQTLHLDSPNAGILPHSLYIFLSPVSPYLHRAIEECERVRVNVLLALNTVVCTKACFKALLKQGWLQNRLYHVSPFY